MTLHGLPQQAKHPSRTAKPLADPDIYASISDRPVSQTDSSIGLDF
jgi:hypothetical protein